MLNPIIKNLLLALPLTLLLTILGAALKLFCGSLFFDQSAGIGAVSSSPLIWLFVEPFIFLLVFGWLQWRAGRRKLDLN